MFGLGSLSRDMLNKDEALKHLQDALGEPLFNTAIAPVQTAMSGFVSFKVDVQDFSDRYELHAELPGVKKEDISLCYDKGYLTIQATNQAEEVLGEGRYLRRERRYGEFARSFYIDGIDKEAIKADFENGVLSVVLPKLPGQDTATHIDIR